MGEDKTTQAIRRNNRILRIRIKAANAFAQAQPPKWGLACNDDVRVS
jgi:hypothetical protein